MKKGCFIKSVAILTILIAAFIYIIEYKLEDWFFEPGKKLVVEGVLNNWDKEANYIKDSPQKDSLKLIVKEYIEDIKSIKEVVNLEEENFFKFFKTAIEDSIITDYELSQLTLLLKEK